MTEPKHTRGELFLSEKHNFLDDQYPQPMGKSIKAKDGYFVARCESTLDADKDEANAARLVQGWNLLNRLEEMGVSAEQVPEIIEALRMVEKRGCGKPLSIVQMLKLSDALAKKA